MHAYHINISLLQIHKLFIITNYTLLTNLQRKQSGSKALNKDKKS